MKQFCRKIKIEYKRYSQILNGIKVVIAKRIALIEGKGAHRKYLLGQSSINFVLNYKGIIKVRQSKSLLMNYGFQVLANEYDKPVLRFDADGVVHYNSRDESIPLTEREIKPPHFHRFDENGIEIAYRTSDLDKNEHEIQNDIKVGMHYFCLENYIQDELGNVINLHTQAEMFPEEVTSDVHKGVIFP